MGTDTRGGGVPGTPSRWAGPPPLPAPMAVPVPVAGLPPAGPQSAAGRGALLRGAIGLGFVALGWGTRALGHWDEGRWWALEAVLVVVGGLLGLTGLVGAVGALGRVRRATAPMAGTSAAALALALSGLAVAGAGVVGGVDWQRLDVPAAWERLDPSDDTQSPVREITREDVEAATAQPEVGDCATGSNGTNGFIGTRVPCDFPHRVEVLEVVIHAAGKDYPSTVDWEALRSDCVERLTPRLAPALRPRIDFAVPRPDAWVAEEPWTLCILRWESAVAGWQGP